MTRHQDALRPADGTHNSGDLLCVEGLTVELRTPYGSVNALEDVSFTVREGESVALVGESGSGKTLTALALMGLLPEPAARVSDGRIIFKDRDLLTLRNRAWRTVRGRQIAMVFQDAMLSLNPLHPVDRQISEHLKHHTSLTRREIRRRSLALLDLVQIQDGERVMRLYPHELSGGMRQRVMIAIALACEPDLIIGDEPTTALDVTVQAEVLKVMREAITASGSAALLITHDLGIVASFAERVVVMYSGRIVEDGPTESVFNRPLHPYTRDLISAIPRIDDAPRSRLHVSEGQQPGLGSRPQGCNYAPRCSHRREVCLTDDPAALLRGRDQRAACARADEWPEGLPTVRAEVP